MLQPRQTTQVLRHVVQRARKERSNTDDCSRSDSDVLDLISMHLNDSQVVLGTPEILKTLQVFNFIVRQIEP